MTGEPISLHKFAIGGIIKLNISFFEGGCYYLIKIFQSFKLVICISYYVKIL